MSIGGSGFGLGFGIRRPDSIVLKRGESVVLSYWNWCFKTTQDTAIFFGTIHTVGAI